MYVMDGLAQQHFGRLPKKIYVVEKKGRIVYKSIWACPAELRQFSMELCASEEPAPATVRDMVREGVGI